MKAPVLVPMATCSSSPVLVSNLQSGLYSPFKEMIFICQIHGVNNPESNKQGSSDEVLSDMDFNDLRDGLILKAIR